MLVSSVFASIVSENIEIKLGQEARLPLNTGRSNFGGFGVFFW